MKLYVDFEELDVEDRPTYICNKYNLQVKSINSGTRYDNVKLVSLADYTKQVRKEVCEIIWGGFVGLNNINGNYEYKKFEDDFRKFLDQIQGETK